MTVSNKAYVYRHLPVTSIIYLYNILIRHRKFGIKGMCHNNY